MSGMLKGYWAGTESPQYCAWAIVFRGGWPDAVMVGYRYGIILFENWRKTPAKYGIRGVWI